MGFCMGYHSVSWLVLISRRSCLLDGGCWMAFWWEMRSGNALGKLEGSILCCCFAGSGGVVS